MTKINKILSSPAQMDAMDKALIMMAYAMGKEIEYLPYNLKFKDWLTVTEPNWDWVHTNYRIKE